MKKIFKMVYEAPLIEVVPMPEEGLMAKLSYAKYVNKETGETEVTGIKTVGDNETGESLNLSKDWGFTGYGDDFDW